MRRLLLRLALLVLFLAVAATVGIWVFLSSWLPANGPGVVIAEIEKRAPVDASIESVAYNPVQGFVLENVIIHDLASGTRLFQTPSLRVRIQWAALALQRKAAFHATAPIEVPFESDVRATGVYDLRSGQLDAHLRSTPIALPSVTAPLTAFIPKGLAGGSIEPDLRIHMRREAPISVAGRILGERIAWNAAPMRALGDVVWEGTAVLPAAGSKDWTMDAAIKLSQGAIEGIPTVGAISALEGSGRLTHQALSIRMLRGRALDTDWSLEGEIPYVPAPSFDLLLTGKVSLAALAPLMPEPYQSEWKLQGTADVRTACRSLMGVNADGSLALDCQALAELTGAGVTAPDLPAPFTNGSGRLRYDHLARKLFIENVRASLSDTPLVVEGSVDFLDQPKLSLGIAGDARLESLTAFLPENSPVQDMLGRAEIDLIVQGPAAKPRVTGRADFHDAKVQIREPALTLEKITGRLLLNEEDFKIENVQLVLQGNPLRIIASGTRSATPQLSASIALANGGLEFRGRVTPEAVVVDDGQLAFGASRLRVAGSIAKTPRQSSNLRLEGNVTLEELKTLPFLQLPQIDAWGLRGNVRLRGTFQGHFENWDGALLSVQVSSERFDFQGIPFEKITLDIQQAQRTLRLQIPQALIADGQFRGDVQIRHTAAGQETALEADLSNMQLARLRQIIPAWRDRAVVGIASGRAVFMGTLQKRETWIGEGWLSATGENLGDVPVLDKFFRGVLFGVLATQLGLEPLRRAEINQASMRWQLHHQRLFTDDLRLGGVAGGNPVSMYVIGSVGLDQTLDLTIEPELSEQLLLEGAQRSFSSAVLNTAGRLNQAKRLIGRYKITGTIQDPDPHFQVDPTELFRKIFDVPTSSGIGAIDNLFDVLQGQ